MSDADELLRALDEDEACEPVAFWTSEHGATVEVWGPPQGDGTRYRTCYKGGTLHEAAANAMSAIVESEFGDE
jgi:hypothetical protein